MLELLNFGHMTTSITESESQNTFLETFNLISLSTLPNGIMAR